MKAEENNKNIFTNNDIHHGRPQGGQNEHLPPWKFGLRIKSF